MPTTQWHFKDQTFLKKWMFPFLANSFALQNIWFSVLFPSQFFQTMNRYWSNSPIHRTILCPAVQIFEQFNYKWQCLNKAVLYPELFIEDTLLHNKNGHFHSKTCLKICAFGQKIWPSHAVGHFQIFLTTAGFEG